MSKFKIDIINVINKCNMIYSTVIVGVCVLPFSQSELNSFNISNKNIEVHTYLWIQGGVFHS